MIHIPGQHVIWGFLMLIVGIIHKCHHLSGRNLCYFSFIGAVIITLSHNK